MQEIEYQKPPTVDEDDGSWTRVSRNQRKKKMKSMIKISSSCHEDGCRCDEKDEEKDEEKGEEKEKDKYEDEDEADDECNEARIEDDELKDQEICEHGGARHHKEQGLTEIMKPEQKKKKKKRGGRWRRMTASERTQLSGLFMKKESQVCPIGQGGVQPKWEPLTITVDSRAAESVMPEDQCTQYPTMDTQASLSGMCYLGADGSEIPNVGERTVCAFTEDGSAARMRFQVCPVTKALGSVSRMTQAGNRGAFDSVDAPEGSYIECKATGERKDLRQENGVYMLDTWVIPANQGTTLAPTFPRPGM